MQLTFLRLCVFLCVFTAASVEDLLKYLDPQFTDHITVPDTMKLEFILAGKKKEVSRARESIKPVLR